MPSLIPTNEHEFRRLYERGVTIRDIAARLGLGCSTAQKRAKKYGLHRREVHGFTTSTTKSRLYVTWQNMKRRCHNPNAHDYGRYGGYGISVCQEWRESFCAFMSWAMDNGYSDKMTIDRVDSTKNYSPENCRWVPLVVNCRDGKVTNKLDMDKARKIRTLKRECGWSYKQLAEKFRVSRGTIGEVVRNKKWREYGIAQ